MRSSDLFYGLLGAMAVFVAVVAVAAEAGGGVVLLLLVLAAVALLVMRARADRAPQVLLVGPAGPSRDLLDGAFDLGGYAVAACAGPGARPCPVLDGRPCPVPAHPLATVAFLESSDTALPPCQRHFRVPTIAVDTGEVAPRRGATRQVHWQDGPRAAVTAVRDLST